MAATLSMAPLVGMLLATPRTFLLAKMACVLAARRASESEGVTKNYRERIILRSASPSQAAPKSGIFALSDSFLNGSINFTSSSAYTRFGSGCNFLSIVIN